MQRAAKAIGNRACGKGTNIGGRSGTFTLTAMNPSRRLFQEPEKFLRRVAHRADVRGLVALVDVPADDALPPFHRHRQILADLPPPFHRLVIRASPPM